MEEDDLFNEERLKTLQSIIDANVNPYPYRFDRTHNVDQILSKYEGHGTDPSEEKVRIAGRLTGKRGHGKVLFCDITDLSGSMQIFVRFNNLGEERFRFFADHLEVGDILGVWGPVFCTKKGELSVWVEGFELLAKSLSELPEKFHGLQNVEKRYRQRYLDLISNPNVREIFKKRARVIQSIRSTMLGRGFMEVETPILQPIYGGANARPFTTHHHFLNKDLFLRIAPELYLKRLVVGGFERVFEIGRNFRNEDIDTQHNPEFTMMECYEAYADYNDVMDLTEELIVNAARDITGGDRVEFSGKEIDLARPWKRLSMEDAVREACGVDLSNTLEEMRSAGEEKGVRDLEDVSTKGEMLAALFEELVESTLIAPTFITDYPVEVSPLAKAHRDREGLTERFELFMNGWEMANGFSELNDPKDQLQRFKGQDRRRLEGDAEAQMIDLDYVKALSQGMPPAGGLGVGIDRLVMILTDNTSIKEVLLFPQMR